ncbi:flagellar biosynthetic protein FliO [Ramlibacter sp. AW1]|uniref:Flagellar protein n=1 Tax=Ramlibacter aurantiacus TaxID=2801330 RepID=A0A937D2C3_9BURK|nr:flagellar biosynthetic protein FliO [Ramlibacter aurantiacus]MBL0421459.1 flagellar biosynthetic protein FliO [Ramlibacter aurantiacus]
MTWSLLMLLLVAALIPASLWLVRRLQTLQPSRGPRVMEVVAQLPLGPRERVTAVRVGRQVLVLGVTAQQITLLAEAPEGSLELPQPSGPRQDFASVMQSVAGRFHPGRPR